MDRRHALVALAAVLATPALAQTMQGGASGGTSASPRAGSMPDGAHPMGQAEMQHMQRTMMTGMVALETSKIALEKARDEDVKQFAKFETDEQTTLSEVLHSMMDPAATASTGQAANQQASNQAATPPMQMDAKGREMIEKMRAQQPGREFDREYVQGQIQGHQELLMIQEDYLKQGRNREHVNVAKLARGQIKEHIALLQDMQKKMR